MTTTNDFQRIADRLTEEMKEQIDDNITSIRGVTDQEYHLSAGAENFEFRPLTEEERQEFVNSLDDEGKEILAELAPRAKR